METYSDAWSLVSGSQPVPTFGFVYDVGLEPVHVNLERMIDNFSLGLRELSSLWGAVLSKSMLRILQRLAKTSKEKFSIPNEVWSEIVYSFAVAAHKKTLSREHLLKSLTPLYLGRTASFVIETWESEAAEVETRIEELCKRFEEDKRMLLEKWA
jgi:glucosylglycerate synthase